MEYGALNELSFDYECSQIPKPTKADDSMNVTKDQSSAPYVYNSEANEELVCREESVIKRYIDLAREEPAIFSEFPSIKVAPTQSKVKDAPTQPKKDLIEITVDMEQENLAVGKGSYTGARHLNNNVAVRGEELWCHANIKVRFNVNGKEVPMTQRFWREWDLMPELGTTVANGKQTRRSLDRRSTPRNAALRYLTCP